MISQKYIAEAEEKKGRKLTADEMAKVDKEVEKGTYVVKDQQIIMTDSNGEKDTLMLSQDGQYLSGKMGEDTPFKLKRKE